MYCARRVRDKMESDQNINRCLDMCGNMTHTPCSGLLGTRKEHFMSTDFRAGEDQAKRLRLDARVSREQKALIQRAAVLSGRSLSDFMVDTLQQAAERVIRSHDVITLSVRGSEALANVFAAPPEPSAALLASYTRYHRQVRDE
jgi:uncharacterized protein (DUF1778 family)